MTQTIYPIGWVDPAKRELAARKAKDVMRRPGAGAAAANAAVIAALIAVLKDRLGLTDADIDDLFRVAATIE